MRTLIAAFLLLCLPIISSSQSCLPDGITFYVQEEIDSFQVNYPGCTVIEGNVYIGDYGGGGDISDLSGLVVLESIGGDLLIRQNDSLESLSGLENIVTIGGQLGIWSNPLLSNLEGLEGLSYVYSLNISSNPALTSLTGIENLESVGYGLYIHDNSSLTSLTGLEGLTSTGCGLSISSNDALLSLEGLDNLETTGCGLSIEFNNALENIEALSKLGYINTGPGTQNISIKNNISLTSLTGLDNIVPGSIGDLSIGWNLALSDCDVYSICQYLADPNGYFAIRYNAPGCNNPQEVLDDCANNCLQDGITFSTQSQIDNFPVFYPECTEIGGDVTISGDDITNLLGLSAITQIGGYLSIAQNNNLASLAGLSGLTSVGSLIISTNSSLINLTGLEGLTNVKGTFAIYGNNILTSLDGLDNLVSIEGNLEIGVNNSLPTLSGLDALINIEGAFDVYYNEVLIDLTGMESLTSIGGKLALQNNNSLTSLTALMNLTSVGGMIHIGYNNALTALWGLDNINAGSVTDLFIGWNENLSSCNAQSICEYLANPNGSPEIHFNATGCNNSGEVEAACGVGVDEPAVSGQRSAVEVYPNPASDRLNIEISRFSSYKNLIAEIYSVDGKLFFRQALIDPISEINIQRLSPGVYVVKVADDFGVWVKKVIIY